MVDAKLPKGITSIHRTKNQEELAQIYSMADVFVNPTREDTFPTVNIEALACGTPVITFDIGGSPEVINESCGVVVKCNDIDTMQSSIVKACEENIFSSISCLERAKMFDKQDKFYEYIKLYNEVMNE